MANADTENVVFSIAADFIINSNASVFLTGKAGTGKTTFLKYIRENCMKHVAIVAPTGVAAINAGGTTIHSFFQLPFAPFLPVHNNGDNGEAMDKHELLGKIRIGAERREVMQQLELLIIDEISMVRCDVLDAIDTVLRHVRNQRHTAFGGVQLLFIGDLYQLPPVVKEEEWKLLGSCYENPYFFSSRVMAERPPLIIELNKVYRQADLSFINLLNKVRNNELDAAAYELLHSRFKPGFKPGSNEHYITLTTHNAKADEINKGELMELGGREHTFRAAIDGVFNEKSYPADEILNIKEGAQVIFLKNDTEKVRRYHNGKTGVIDAIEDDKIHVRCVNGDEELLIEVKKETWRNVQYSIDKKSHQVTEQEIGSFIQYPLRLAWAITIHKSQGLTFERAIIDAGSAFAPGQVYVALSRCTSLDGIVLKSRISEKSLHSDDRIVRYCSGYINEQDQQNLLEKAKNKYRKDVLSGLFDFNGIMDIFSGLSAFAKENDVFDKQVSGWLKQIQQQLELFTGHSNKFISVLKNHFSESDSIDENNVINTRIIHAAEWYRSAFAELKNLVRQSPAISDNRQLAADYNEKLNKFWDAINLRLCLFTEVSVNGFSVETLRRQRSAFIKEPLDVNAYSGKSAYVPKDILHPELYFALKEKRDVIANDKGLPIYMVCGTLSLEQMANYLPVNLQDLGKVIGFGKIKLKQFGNEFINIIRNYCEQNQIEASAFIVPEKLVKKTRNKSSKKEKPDSRKISYELFREGKTIPEIALTRNLATSTVEGHLAHYIETGFMDIDELVDKEKQLNISGVIQKSGTESLSKIKEQLPGVSYGELKWVMASVKIRDGLN